MKIQISVRLHQHVNQIYGFKCSWGCSATFSHQGATSAVFLICKSGDSMINSGMCFYSVMTCDWPLAVFKVVWKPGREGSSDVQLERQIAKARGKQPLCFRAVLFLQTSQHKVLPLQQTNQLSDRDYCRWIYSVHCTACPPLSQPFLPHNGTK